jgi:ABC-2 type transport system permease protein
MSDESTGLSEPFPDAAVSAPPAALAPTRPLYWSIRRELWENRSLYVGPLIAAGVVLFGFAVHYALTLPRRIGNLPALGPARQEAVLGAPFGFAASMVIVAGYVVAAFYCLDALHGERRDRSILFWKSLPVSDLTTVLSKASIPYAVVPAIVVAIALATQLAILLMSTLVLAASGVGAGALWMRLPLLQMPIVLVYGVIVHVLWHAPLFAWLLLVSAWARRTPLLWAILPLALGVLERIIFQSTHFFAFVGYRVVGAMALAFSADPHKQPILFLGQLSPLRVLGSAGLWTGLLAAALLLAAAVRLRRYREPI